MSVVSYISFPREVDTSALEDGMAALKSYKIGELTWGEYGKRIVRSPSGMEGTLIDCNELIEKGIFIHGLAVRDDSEGATFKSCFKNKYIYKFWGGLGYGISQHTPVSMYEESEFISNYVRANLIETELCRKQLRDLLIHNLHEGEFAEIYTDFVHDTDFNFGPPLNELILTTDDILFSSELCLDERLRVEIRR
ncbi:MAG: hypothetical protein FWB80_11235 [Defluviitaleaceae bacterium]|nr:hypothetical protein [Defluviitaleaceae bacterium]